MITFRMLSPTRKLAPLAMMAASHMKTKMTSASSAAMMTKPLMKTKMASALPSIASLPAVENIALSPSCLIMSNAASRSRLSSNVTNDSSQTRNHGLAFETQLPHWVMLEGTMTKTTTIAPSTMTKTNTIAPLSTMTPVIRRKTSTSWTSLHNFLVAESQIGRNSNIRVRMSVQKSMNEKENKV